KSTDFRHVILLMTSNVGARDLGRRAVGFGDRRATGDAEREYKLLFSPEFRNRLDARVQFDALSPETMGSIVDKFMKELSGQLAERKVVLELTPAARLHLSQKGYDPDFGARPLARVIQEDVKQPLGEELLFAKLEKGGKVVIDAEDAPPDPDDEAAAKEEAGEKKPSKKLVFHFESAAAPSKEKKPTTTAA